MKPMYQKIIVYGVIIVQICIISYLWYGIRLKRTIPNNMLGVSTTQLHKNTLIFPTLSSALYFYEPKPNQTEEEHPNWLEYTATHTTNNDGIHDRYDYQVTTNTGTCKIMTIGDSFTYGSYVSTSENWTELLEDQLNASKPNSSIDAYEVINLGVPGYDIQYALLRFQLRGEKYNPDIVLWLLKDDDFSEIYELLAPKINEFSKMITPDERIERIDKHQDYYPEWTLAIDEMNKQYTIDELLDQEDSFFHPLLATYSNTLILVTFPFTNDRYKALMRGWASQRPKTVFTDTLTNIYANNNYLPDGHPDKHGHRAIATYMFDYLQNNSALCDK